MVVFASYSVLHVVLITLTLIPVSLSQQTLCDEQRALTIPTNELTSEKWYMQLIGFPSQDFPCAQFCFNTDSDNNIISINGSYIQSSNTSEGLVPVNIPVSVSNNNGTVILFRDWPNVKLQFVDYSNGSVILKNIVMLVCNAKYVLSGLAIATTERNVSEAQLLLVEALADAHNPGLNASSADNSYIDQNNCSND